MLFFEEKTLGDVYLQKPSEAQMEGNVRDPRVLEGGEVQWPVLADPALPCASCVSEK